MNEQRTTNTGTSSLLTSKSSWLARARDSLFDIIFPARCIGCGRSGATLCQDCLNTIEYVPSSICNRCGRPIRDPSRGFCNPCADVTPSLTGCFAVTYTSGVMRDAIHRLKYSDQSRLADPLASFLIRWWEMNPLPTDLVIPVPLHPQREKERGYNQAELLSRRLSAAIGLPHEKKSLSRTRYTQPQVGLGAIERHKNVAGAFRCVDNMVAGQSILLIDDVTTTGATLEAAALALTQAGACEVWGLTVARAKPASLRGKQ